MARALDPGGGDAFTRLAWHGASVLTAARHRDQHRPLPQAGLSPRERHDEMVAGKYGIGLLGF